MWQTVSVRVIDEEAEKLAAEQSQIDVILAEANNSASTSSAVSVSVYSVIRSHW